MDVLYKAGNSQEVSRGKPKGQSAYHIKRNGNDEKALVSLRHSVVAIMCKPGLILRGAITKAVSLIAKAMIGF